jgi:hypothetical protein
VTNSDRGFPVAALFRSLEPPTTKRQKERIIGLPADWLFTWVTKLESDPAKAYSAVLYGYGNAFKIQKDMLYN